MLKYAFSAMCICFGLGCVEDSKSIRKNADISYCVPQKQIHIDGNIDDWKDINENIVRDKGQLWFGQGMEPDNWQGNDDLSFAWKAAWYANKLFFLITVSDDNVQPCLQEYSWLNDCVEIYLDPDNRGGQRIQDVVTSTPIEERISKTIIGYETHFLPCSPPQIYLNDTVSVYRTKNHQNKIFYSDWDGEINVKQTPSGYVMEIGFTVPRIKLYPGKIMGVDIAVCDDDGAGRKSLMLWSGKKVDFWITMDYFGKIKLVP